MKYLNVLEVMNVRKNGLQIKAIMNNSERLRNKIRQLLDSQNLCVLSTHNNGQPYASLVAFAASADLKIMLFATARTTRKYFNLSSDARVAMLIDSRTNQYSDFHQAIAATALGKADEVKIEQREAYLDLYLSKHPHLQDFVNSPSCAFIQIEVDSYYLVSRFQEVMELHIRP